MLRVSPQQHDSIFSQTVVQFATLRLTKGDFTKKDEI